MALEWLTQTLAGYEDVLYAAWLIAITFLVGKSVFFVFQNYVLNLKKSPSGLNQRIAAEVRVPFYLIVGAIGLYYSIGSVRILEPYEQSVKIVFAVFAVCLGVYLTRKAINTAIVWYSSKDKRRIMIEKTALASLRNLMDIFIYATAAIVILMQFGIEVTPFLASLGIGVWR